MNLDARDKTIALFRAYLLRDPSETEITVHTKTLVSLGTDYLSRQFAYCDEAARLDTPMRIHPSWSNPIIGAPESKPDPGKVAIQISGHFRSFERVFPAILANLIKPLDADVFIHTWSTRGTKVNTGSIAPTPDSNKIDVMAGISMLEKVVSYEVDDCAQHLAKSQNDPNAILYGIPYRGKIGGSAEPKYIDSQLYSVWRASALREASEASSGVKYDTVIKMRADYCPTNQLPANEWRADPDTVWVPGSCANHAHPSCRYCRLTPHDGPHGSDVCDLFAIGSSETISHYCNIFHAAPSLYSRLQSENNAYASAEPQRKFAMFDKWKTVNIWGPGGHKYHCYYPERLFREYLIGYRLLPSSLSGSIIK